MRNLTIALATLAGFLAVVTLALWLANGSNDASSDANISQMFPATPLLPHPPAAQPAPPPPPQPQAQIPAQPEPEPQPAPTPAPAAQAEPQMSLPQTQLPGDAPDAAAAPETPPRPVLQSKPVVEPPTSRADAIVHNIKTILALPQQVDGVTQLIDVRAEKETIVFVFVVQADSKTFTEATDAIRKANPANGCSREDFRQVLALGIPITLEYRSQEGVRAAPITITPADCKLP